MLEELRHHRLCRGLNDEQLNKLCELGTVQTVEKQTTLVKENDSANYFYILVKGTVKVTKSTVDQQGTQTTHVLAQLQPGALMGEMSLIENKPRSATLITQTSAVLIRFDIEQIKSDLDLLSAISRNIAIDLSDRLRYTNEVTLKSMTNELTEVKKRVSLGVFIVSILWLVSTFSLALSLVDVIKQRYPTTALISTVFIAVIAVMIFIFMTQHHFKLYEFGLTLRQWKKNAMQAIIFSLPLVILYTVVKAIFVFVLASDSTESLFSPYNYFQNHHHIDTTLYVTTWLAYILLVPLQEFVVRGALQSSFKKFLPGSGTSNDWQAIILANLMFAMMLAHTDIKLALSSLLPGLFFGWLYNRQESLLGVCLSHCLIGSYVLFILGMPNDLLFSHSIFAS